MILRPGQSLKRNGPDDQPVLNPTVPTKPELLVESELQLKLFLDKLGCKPVGMLSDFDLYTKHSSAEEMQLLPDGESKPKTFFVCPDLIN